MDARIAERRAAVRRQRMTHRRRRTIIVLVVAAVAAAGYWLVNSPLLQLAEVEVRGTERLDPATVRRAADLPLGASTVTLPLDAARTRVEALPWVAKATLRRVDPLTVAILVEERRPALVLAARNGAALVDAAGIVLEAGREPGLPVIEAPSLARPDPGTDLSEFPVAANAHRVFTALPGPLRTEVQRYRATGPDDVTLVLRNGPAVRFGRAADTAEKARVLGALLERVGDVAAVDVRVPGNPVVLPGAPHDAGQASGSGASGSPDDGAGA